MAAQQAVFPHAAGKSEPCPGLLALPADLPVWYFGGSPKAVNARSSAIFWSASASRSRSSRISTGPGA